MRCASAKTEGHWNGKGACVRKGMKNLSDLTCGLVGRASSSVSSATQLAVEGSPSALFEAAAELGQAVRAVAEFEREAGTCTQEVRLRARGELERIRLELKLVSSLLASAADFHAGWALAASRRDASYGPNGSESCVRPAAATGSRVSASA